MPRSGSRCLAVRSTALTMRLYDRPWHGARTRVKGRSAVGPAWRPFAAGNPRVGRVRVRSEAVGQQDLLRTLATFCGLSCTCKPQQQLRWRRRRRRRWRQLLPHLLPAKAACLAPHSGQLRRSRSRGCRRVEAPPSHAREHAEQPSVKRRRQPVGQAQQRVLQLQDDHADVVLRHDNVRPPRPS